MMPGISQHNTETNGQSQKCPAFAGGGFALCFHPSLYAFWIGVAGAVTPMVCSKTASAASCFFAFSCGLGALLWYFFLVRLVSHHQAKFQKTTFEKKCFSILGYFLIAFAIFTFISAFANIN
jgi:hypothetical protein